MNSKQIGGIVLGVVGVILLIVGINASDSVSDQLSNFFTGTFTDSTVWYMVGGVALTLGGILLLIFGGRRSGA
jgi:hypothetical protein